MSRTTIAADAFHMEPPAAPATTVSVSGGGGGSGRDVLAALFVGHAPAGDGGSPVGLGSGGVENKNPSPNTSPKPGAAALPQASPLAGGGELAGAVYPDPNPGPGLTARIGEPPRSPVRSSNLPRVPRDRTGLSSPPLLPDAGWCVLSLLDREAGVGGCTQRVWLCGPSRDSRVSHVLLEGCCGPKGGSGWQGQCSALGTISGGHR